MRAVIQRVSEASVTVDQAVSGRIQRGFLVLAGVADDDEEKDALWIAEKIAGLRVFEDYQSKTVWITGESYAGQCVDGFVVVASSRHRQRFRFLTVSSFVLARLLRSLHSPQHPQEHATIS